MSDLRKAAQMALEALDGDHPDIQLRAAITLRAALAQPEQTAMPPDIAKVLFDNVESLYVEDAQPEPFNPDWDRVKALEESLREHMAEIHRLKSLAQPEPWMGVSDNPYASDADCNDPNGRAMSWHNKLQTRTQQMRDAGYTRRPRQLPKEDEQEPVMFNGLTEAETNASASVMGLTPPKRKPLTEKEIGKATEHIAGMHCAIVDEIARAIEAAHGIGGEHE